jgi:transcription termination factor Rho
MYEIATLKTKKLPELQEIAKKIGIKRITGLKKLDLIYQIVDFIASRPDEESKSEKPKETSPPEEKKISIKVLPVQKSKPKPQKENQHHQKNNYPNQKKQYSIKTTITPTKTVLKKEMITKTKTVKTIITTKTIKADIVNQTLNLME